MRTFNFPRKETLEADDVLLVDGPGGTKTILAAELSNGRILGQTGKQYKIVACVLQNNGSGVWVQIAGAHKSVNVDSISTSEIAITIVHNFSAANVVSFVVCPDETFAKNGYIFGCSVGVTTTVITCARSFSLGGYLSYSGSAWTTNGAGFAGTPSFNTDTGALTIPHDLIGGTIGSVSCRDGTYIAQLGSMAAGNTVVTFHDYAGNVILAPDTSMKLYFNRTVSPLTVVNPTTLNVTGANIWCYGIFEVA
jgi:hypothetical protein